MDTKEMIEFTRPTGKRIAVDRYAIRVIEELDDEQCALVFDGTEPEATSIAIRGSFDENVARVKRADEDEPDEPWRRSL